MNLAQARAFTAAQATEVDQRTEYRIRTAEAEAEAERIQLREIEQRTAQMRHLVAGGVAASDHIVGSCLAAAQEYGFRPVPTDQDRDVRNSPDEEAASSLAGSILQAADQAAAPAVDAYKNALGLWREALNQHLYAAALLRNRKQQEQGNEQYRADLQRVLTARAKSRLVPLLLIAAAAFAVLLVCGLMLFWVPVVAVAQIAGIRVYGTKRRAAERSWGALIGALIVADLTLWALFSFTTTVTLLLNLFVVPAAVKVLQNVAAHDSVDPLPVAEAFAGAALPSRPEETTALQMTGPDLYGKLHSNPPPPPPGAHHG